MRPKQLRLKLTSCQCGNLLASLSLHDLVAFFLCLTGCHLSIHEFGHQSQVSLRLDKQDEKCTFHKVDIVANATGTQLICSSSKLFAKQYFQLNSFMKWETFGRSFFTGFACSVRAQTLGSITELCTRAQSKKKGPLCLLTPASQKFAIGPRLGLESGVLINLATTSH